MPRPLQRLQLGAIAGACLSLYVAVTSTALGAEQNRCSSRVCVESLDELSIDTMRKLHWQARIGEPVPIDDVSLLGYSPNEVSPSDSAVSGTFMLPYWSDDLRQYARLDLPEVTTSCGVPLVVFVHGWAGVEAAPSYDFALDGDGLYAEILAELTSAGFAVLYPGLRGHGTVDGIAADGIDYMQSWDNSSYLSPVFYARDVLNLLQGVHDLDQQCDQTKPSSPLAAIDRRSVFLLAHSQGGDALLTVLAVAGANPNVEQSIGAASIWSGNIPDRFTQANTFGPMGSTVQAFLSGDGTWTGSAIGSDGSVNRDFVFAWPADWIGTVDTSSEEWTWQAKTWAVADVETALRAKYQEMYEYLNRNVAELGDAEFSMHRATEGKLMVAHDPRVATQMPRIGGFAFGHQVKAPLHLHYSDRDYYSLPAWNQKLAANIKSQQGQVESFEYPGTNHSLKISQHAWFSPPGTREGVALAIARDIALFNAVMSNLETLEDHER